MSTLGNALFARGEESRLKEGEAKVAAQYQQQLSEGLKNFFNTMHGSDQEIAGPATPEGGTDTLHTPGDPIRAAIEAQGSQLPQIQAIGAELAKAMYGKMIGPTDILRYGKDAGANLPSIIRAIQGGSNVGELRPMGKPEVVEGNVVDTGPVIAGTGPAVKGPFMGQTYGPAAENPALGGIPSQTSNESGKTQGVSGGWTSTPPVAGDRAGMEAFGKDLADKIITGKSQLTQTQQNLPRILATQELVNKAMVGSPLSDIQLTASKLARQLGMNPDEAGKIPSTEILLSNLGQNVKANVKAFGTGTSITEKDVQYTKQIEAAGSFSDPRTISAMNALRFAQYLNEANIHDQNIARAQAAGQDFPGLARMAPNYSHKVDVQITPEVEKAFQLYKDPASGMWTTHLTDVLPGGAGGAPAAPDVNSLVDKYTRQK